MMIARVARFEGVNADVAESTMQEAEAIIRPMVEGLAGYAGHLELMAPNGEGLSINFFDSDENAEAAEPVFDEEMPQKLGHLFSEWGGRRVSVGRFKVVVDERR
jgi:hypothetical protein